jgi:hypothetical protein
VVTRVTEKHPELITFYTPLVSASTRVSIRVGVGAIGSVGVVLHVVLGSVLVFRLTLNNL